MTSISISCELQVRTWAERCNAEDTARSLPGAISVNNIIEVDTSILVNAK